MSMGIEKREAPSGLSARGRDKKAQHSAQNLQIGCTLSSTPARPDASTFASIMLAPFVHNCHQIAREMREMRE